MPGNGKELHPYNFRLGFHLLHLLYGDGYSFLPARDAWIFSHESTPYGFIPF